MSPQQKYMSHIATVSDGTIGLSYILSVFFCIPVGVETCNDITYAKHFDHS